MRWHGACDIRLVNDVVLQAMQTQFTNRCQFEIRFSSLFHEGRAFAFPCDADGHVDMDTMSERARNNYLFAHAMVGREFATPAVLATEAA